MQPGHLRKTFYSFLKKLILFLAVLSFVQANGQISSKNGWYTEGNFVPQHRIRVEVTNLLKIQLKDQPVVIDRTQLPFQNIPERWVAVVDPNLPENPAPTAEELKKMGGYVKMKETNGQRTKKQSAARQDAGSNSPASCRVLRLAGTWTPHQDQMFYGQSEYAVEPEVPA